MNKQAFFNEEVEKINQIKENLRNLSWEEVENNKEIIRTTLANDLEINIASMLLAERVLMLSQLFKNYQIIPQNVATKILEIFINTNLQTGLEKFKTDINLICPGLELINSEQLSTLQTDCVGLVNGLKNMKKIALIKIAEEIFLDINVIKTLPKNKINFYVLKINDLSMAIQTMIIKFQDPAKEQIDEIGSILKTLGRSNFEVDSLTQKQNYLVLIDIFQKTKEALNVIQYANKYNIIEQLNNVENIAAILEKIKSK